MDDCSPVGTALVIAKTTGRIAIEGPKYGVYPKESKLKAYMPMMYAGLLDSASEQDALDYAKIHLMIADRGYEVSSDGLERVLGAPVTMDTQFTADALSKRIQDCTSLGALIEHLDPPPRRVGTPKVLFDHQRPPPGQAAWPRAAQGANIYT